MQPCDATRRINLYEGVGVVSLVERFGEDRAHQDTLACIEAVAAEVFGDTDTMRPADPEQGP